MRNSMRVETNVKLASRNRSIANYLFLATLVVLIGGFFFINSSIFASETVDPTLLILQVLVLPVTFIMTLLSIRMTNLWARPPRPENVLPEALKGISKKSVLYNYYHLPVRHLLICPQGVFAIVTRWHDGTFDVENDEFHARINPISRFLSALRMDGVGNPIADAQKAAAHAQKLIQPFAPDVQVKPLVVFVNPRVELNVASSSVPVLYADGKRKPSLKDYTRDLYASTPESRRSLMPLTEEQIAAFEKATMPQA